MFIALPLLFAVCASPQETGGSWEEVFKRKSGGFSSAQSLARLDDLNGDGIPEIAAGLSGEVEILNGADGSLIRTLLPAVAQHSGFGAQICAIPDLNGDGEADLVISAPQGAAVEIHSSQGAFLSAMQGSGNAEQASFGFAIGTIADLNGDGRDEILVGMPFATTAIGGAEGGAVEIYSGATQQLLLRVEGAEKTGRYVASTSDFDGDGEDDLVVHCEAPFDYGAVDFYSSASGAHLKRIAAGPLFGSDALNARFGEEFCRLPDLDGDGRDELLVGAQWFGRGGGWGAWWVFSSIDDSVLYSATGVGQYDALGVELAAAGDFDGDQVPDFLVTSQQFNGASGGAVMVYSGATGEELVRAVGSEFGSGSVGYHSPLAIGEHGDAHLSVLTAGYPKRLSFTPYLRVQQNGWSQSSAQRVALEIDFPATAAGAPYFLLASAAGRGSIDYGVEIPLQYDRAFAWTWQGQSIGLDRANWRGTLNADGNATAWLAPAPGIGAHLIGSYHLAAVALESPGGLAQFASFAVPFEVLP